MADEIKTELHGKVDVANTKTVKSTVGTMTTGKGVNVGSISVEGGAVLSTVLLGLLVSVVVFLKKFLTSRKLLHFLIEYIEISTTDRIKKDIKNVAIKQGVEPFLKARVKKVTKKSSCGCGKGG